MSKAQLGAGDVAITINGVEEVLRPTLKAALSISRSSGGFRKAIQAVNDVDVDAIVSTIAFGLGIEGKAVDELLDRVYASGLASLVVPVSSYLLILANGGRPATTTTEGGSGEDNPRT